MTSENLLGRRISSLLPVGFKGKTAVGRSVILILVSKLL